MKICFYTWLTDDFKDSVIDYQGFIKSFKYFHPDIDLYVFTDEIINRLFSEKPWLNQFNCKASFAKLLYNDYDLVVNLDCDFYFFDRLHEILQGDYEVAACANYNRTYNVDMKQQSIGEYNIPYVSHVDYIQGGLVASTSKRFWDEYETICERISMDLFLYENDILNMLWYSNNYKTKVLDGDVDYRNPNFKQWYNCATLGLQGQFKIVDNKVYFEDKPVRSFHVAGGNTGAVGKTKPRVHQLFSPEVTDWFNNTVLKHDITNNNSDNKQDMRKFLI